MLVSRARVITHPLTMPGRALDYVKELGVARCQETLEARRPRNGRNRCWLFVGSRNTDGYGQVSLKPTARLKDKGRGAQKAYLLHIIAYVARNGVHDTELRVSHRCAQRSCFNPDHLVAETAVANMSRKGCPGDIICTCKRLAFTCPHTPNCIGLARRIPARIE